MYIYIYKTGFTYCYRYIVMTGETSRKKEADLHI